MFNKRHLLTQSFVTDVIQKLFSDVFQCAFTKSNVFTFVVVVQNIVIEGIDDRKILSV